MDTNIDIKSYLQDNGFKVKQSNGECQIVAKWRDGVRYNVSINLRNGKWVDFVTNEGGEWASLVKIIGGEYNGTNFTTFNDVEELSLPKKYDKLILDHLIKDYNYWESRKISKSVCQSFRGGLATKETFPQLAGRFATPIFNLNNEVVGWSARYVGNNPDVKTQKILGVKREFVFPLNLNVDIIKKTQRVILTEGAGDIYSFFTAGIQDCLCLFGTNLSSKLLSTLISLNVKKIVIATNFDEHGVGQAAAETIKSKLLNFFDESVVEIRLPTRKDINKMLVMDGTNSIQELYGLK